MFLKDDVENVDSDIYLMTHTTNPFLEKTTIINAINLFLEQQNHRNVDSLFTVNKIQTRFYRENCEPVNHDQTTLFRPKT